MKKSLLFLALLLFSMTAVLACPCPTSGTTGSNSVIIRDLVVTSAIDFTGVGEPIAPVALSTYLSTTTVTKTSPTATFLAGNLYRYNAGNWELFLFAPGSTAIVGGAPYTFSNPWQLTSDVTNISQYVDPMGTAARTTVVAGIAAFTATPLAANGVWTSGWLALSGYQSVMQSYSADVAGTLVFDYSNDGVTALAGQSSNLIYPPSGITLNSPVVNHFPTTKAKYFRIIYTNNSVAQTSFNVMIRLSLDASVSAQTLSAILFDSAIAQVNKSVIATPDGGGVYGKLTRTGTALDVNVTNSAGSGLTDTQLRATPLPVSGTFWPATQPISGSVTATISGTPAVTVSELAKTAVQRTGTLVTTATTADQVVATYTVTAGKTFYLQSLSMQGSLTAISAVASIMGTISLERPSGTKVVTFRAVNPTVSVHPVFTLDQGSVPIPAGTVIRVVVTPAAATSTTWIANFGGYEQ